MFNVSEILKATGGRILLDSKNSKIEGVSIDSRTIREDELFIAIKGTRYDGHTFIKQALEKTASGAIVCSSRTLSTDIMELSKKSRRFIISVSDTSEALGQIARFHREKFDIPLVAVTGSNGKTTTKEMISSILHKKWSPLKTFGTYNNLIGVPLTLLRITHDNKSAVLELGMNRQGEIKKLAEMVRPNIGLITNIGPSHLEHLQSLEGVYRTKKELLDFLGRGDIAVLNNDSIFLQRFKKRGLKIVTFGINTESDFKATHIRRNKKGWEFGIRNESFFVSLFAYHEVYNALAAITVGMLFNVSTKEIEEALSNYKPLERRMQRYILHGIIFIDDTYNSNPLSLEGAIKTLSDYEAKGKKILVNGDMLELGKKARYYHQRIGRLIAHSRIDDFIGVGELMKNSIFAARRSGMKNAWFCPSKEEAANLLKDITKADDIVLVKGSRAMQMEEVIKCFITSFTP